MADQQLIIITSFSMFSSKIFTRPEKLAIMKKLVLSYVLTIFSSKRDSLALSF